MKTIHLTLPKARAWSGAEGNPQEAVQEAIDNHSYIESIRRTANGEANLFATGLLESEYREIRPDVLRTLGSLTSMQDRLEFISDSPYTDLLYSVDISHVEHPSPADVYAAQDAEFRELCQAQGLTVLEPDTESSDTNYTALARSIAGGGTEVLTLEETRRLAMKEHEDFILKIRERTGIVALNLNAFKAIPSHSERHAMVTQLYTTPSIHRSAIAQQGVASSVELENEALRELFDSALLGETDQAWVVSRTLYAYLERHEPPDTLPTSPDEPESEQDRALRQLALNQYQYISR